MIQERCFHCGAWFTDPAAGALQHKHAGGGLYRVVDQLRQFGLPFEAGAKVAVRRPLNWSAGLLWWSSELNQFADLPARVVGVPYVPSRRAFAYDGTVCYLDLHPLYLFAFDWLTPL